MPWTWPCWSVGHPSLWARKTQSNRPCKQPLQWAYLAIGPWLLGLTQSVWPSQHSLRFALQCKWLPLCLWIIQLLQHVHTFSFCSAPAHRNNTALSALVSVNPPTSLLTRSAVLVPTTSLAHSIFTPQANVGQIQIMWVKSILSWQCEQHKPHRTSSF